MSLSVERLSSPTKRKRTCEYCVRSNYQRDSEAAPCQHCGSSSRSWQHNYRDDLVDPALQRGPIVTPRPVPLSHSSRAAGLDHRTLWQTSPTSQGRGPSSQHDSPESSTYPSVASLGQNYGSDRGNDETGTISAILSRFLNGGLETRTNPGISPNEISLTAAASFFRTYFTVIHPQYPFLDIKLCAEYYTTWTQSLPNAAPTGWPAFFVNMIFAIGSLIESKSDNSPDPKYQNLKSRAQAEQSIMTDSTSTPLIRLQAMLLSAMFALHAESTWRIAHISGAIVKFATLHRFHRLKKDPESPSNLMAIRVWSCAYNIDRAVSSALGTPVSLPDMYISTPSFEAPPETQVRLPWLSDCGTSQDALFFDLKTFAHVCNIRSIQSFFMHTVERDDIEDVIPFELEAQMLDKLRHWEDPGVISEHSVHSSHGYQSSLWLHHIAHLTRLSIFFVNKSNIFSSTADNALKASCAVCTSFRSLQKKKHIAQPWLVVISQFRAAVTLWYTVWARAISVPKEANNALRDCSAALAIFADRWPKAEHYRDCFELLAVSIPRCQPLGHLSKDTRKSLQALVTKLEESGIHRITSRMLHEMCKDSQI
ncbi:hypothetical protein B0J13DRAFT_679418 [Dactylonectria estremocensis]|uniref:Xylanolytic transcriptional activator regulatory domain-containing protein n=1 Tax=Dactylonectria estremocensis TaxID=1079267 RepID=A0A9P9DX26_9HYPO|nr:hypothetical protein B0J13DRAFT_679418 [Dactylonectria estremocensis]